MGILAYFEIATKHVSSVQICFAHGVVIGHHSSGDEEIVADIARSSDQKKGIDQ